MNAVFTGSGPGPQTADGCSVELYRRLPYRGELEPLRSHLTADAAVRQALVACAARHVRRGGQLLMERHDPQWLATVMPGPSGHGHGVTMAVEAVKHAGVASDISLRYEADGQVWRQRFTAAHLDQSAIECLLADAGFGRFAWVGDRAPWVIAERCR